MGDLFDLFFNSVFVGNILLAYFLGMCSFVAVSKTLRTAVGLGLAVVFVLTITSPANWLIYHLLLAPGALSWAGLPEVDLNFLKYITFIATIAAMVQVVEMIIDRYSPTLYTNLGVFLPLIAVNCAILGTSLFMVERHYTFTESVVFGFGSGTGWMVAIITMAAIRVKMRYAHVPHGLKGFGITMIVSGLMAMSFMIFSGMGT
ncbi:NADH:ubiquinone reductase (Na(+)-transporting) subunit E [Desulfoluna spongiiphila]|uniref:Na(+)-translocating NADH-quinone reductase subunit E n=1 Tax=Desulfoluna spongiiphila TaxID=419481 RepID=A0A1G5GAQ4_9BACT|nr:NADH:ubiquinone reductase (Na(+)-transporting) subunit E [Desulfoluna spongiiphila]SCY48625.1 Na+-transporting NADH:ubiquinone oxidoreductase subunit E [Desulfoluna spongiiphila]VVS93673.1 na(+)-translocating nadh-quinone reductase subunit e [Desulfoluna spongiiphila]